MRGRLLVTKEGMCSHPSGVLGEVGEWVEEVVGEWLDEEEVVDEV